MDLATDDDWILNASYIDKTFMRHKLSYDLFREMSENNKAPVSSYIQLFDNDEYQGIYLLMQEMTASSLEMNKGDSEAALFKDTYIF